MSGGALAFQKLNGAGTQMQNLIDSVNKSDLYKMAKEFAPSVNLVPVTKSWEIGLNTNSVNDLALGGLYFGKWVLNHNSTDEASSDNSHKRSQAFLKYGGEVVARTMINIHGDDILAWGTETTEHYGFATSLHLHKMYEDDQPVHSVQVSFIGYKTSNDPGFIFPAPEIINNPNFSGNVGLSAQDLTTAGYTYQWNVTTGVGVFVNPSNPNTQFVPDGNGNYVLELVVTDGNGNVSTPVVVPVEVDYRENIIRINNFGIRDITLFDNSVLGVGQTQYKYGSLGTSYRLYTNLLQFYQRYVKDETYQGSTNSTAIDNGRFDQEYPFSVDERVLDIGNVDGPDYGMGIKNSLAVDLKATFDIGVYTIAPAATLGTGTGRPVDIVASVPFTGTDQNDTYNSVPFGLLHKLSVEYYGEIEIIAI